MVNKGAGHALAEVVSRQHRVDSWDLNYLTILHQDKLVCAQLVRQLDTGGLLHVVREFQLLEPLL